MSARKTVIALFFLLISGTILPNHVKAQEEVQQDSIVQITLTDGSVIRGRIVQETDTEIRIITASGIEMTLPRSSIVSIGESRGRMVEGEFRQSDPNYSRLFFSPTGRPLRKGDGYFSDFYIVFPSVAYGVTDNFSFMAGMSIIPTLGLGNQLFYVAPRIGGDVGENASISAGILYATMANEGFGAGIAFATGTFGEPDESITVGMGWGYAMDTGGDFFFEERPIILVGGNFRLSNSVAFVTENWLITGANTNAWPFTVGLRFFGERVAADLGFILIGEALSEGFPIPLASFVYNFGK